MQIFGNQKDKSDQNDRRVFDRNERRQSMTPADYEAERQRLLLMTMDRILDIQQAIRAGQKKA